MYNDSFAGSLVTPQLPDADVIARVLAGEKDLYAILVRRYNPRLYRIGMSIINDDAEVEELMQTTYIKAYESLGKFSFRADFSTWLTRILMNECFQFLRRRRNALKFHGKIMNYFLDQRTTESSTPAAQVMNAELGSILEQAILQLPEKYRIVFIMREIEKINIAETKPCLQLSGISVKVTLNRAKALLRKSLKTYYQNDGILNFHLSRCNRMVSEVLTRIG